LKFFQFDELVDMEFLSLDEHHARQCASLTEIVRFAAEQVPYYERLCRKHGLDGRDIKEPADLSALPLLNKQSILDEWNDFRPRAFQKGHKAVNEDKSSGTTGPPVTIYHNQQTSDMFAVLNQRELRWFHFDPEGLYAAIRWPSDLPDKSAEDSPDQDVTYHRPQ
jgi:phenylacetate-coenzyme A ligase PaaK-like adenylate-forming protein